MNHTASRWGAYSEAALIAALAAYPTLRLVERSRGAELDPLNVLYIGTSGFVARLTIAAALGLLFALPLHLRLPSQSSSGHWRAWVLPAVAVYFASVAVAVP
jgi:uncharacterized membrane protein